MTPDTPTLDAGAPRRSKLVRGAAAGAAIAVTLILLAAAGVGAAALAVMLGAAWLLALLLEAILAGAALGAVVGIFSGRGRRAEPAALRAPPPRLPDAGPRPR